MFTKLRNRLGRLPTISAQEVADLQRVNIRDQKILLDRFDGAPDSGIQTLADIPRINIAKPRIAELLCDSVLVASKPMVRPFMRTYWLDILLGLATISILLGIAFPLRTRLRSQKTEPAPQPRAIALVPIPVFGMIREGDIRIENISDESKRHSFSQGFVGHYVTSAIQKGKEITNGSVSSKAIDLDTLHIAQVTISNTPPLGGRDLPERVDLLLSHRQQPALSMRIPALLLALNSSGTVTSATLAVSQDALSELGKHVGSCDAYLSFPPLADRISGIFAGQGSHH
jgi:hypothetical protein